MSVTETVTPGRRRDTVWLQLDLGMGLEWEPWSAQWLRCLRWSQVRTQAPKGRSGFRHMALVVGRWLAGPVGDLLLMRGRTLIDVSARGMAVCCLYRLEALGCSDVTPAHPARDLRCTRSAVEWTLRLAFLESAALLPQQCRPREEARERWTEPA